MTDNPKSTLARRLRAANPRAKRHDIRNDLKRNNCLEEEGSVWNWNTGLRGHALEGVRRG